MEDFERRAQEGERRLAALEARLDALGGAAPAGGAAAATSDEEFRQLVLQQLYALRDAMAKAKQEMAGLEAERDAAKKEAAAAKEECGKLEYRVKHLVQSLKEQDATQGAPAPPELTRFTTTPFAK